VALPNFLGIGPQRSGSTWLYQQLSGHADVYMSKRKEVNFFDKNYSKGIEWYEDFFIDSATQNFAAVGEVSPAYLYSSHVPELIYKHLPEAKFISILRNPIDRAISQYKYAVRNNNDTRTLLQYLHETDVIERGFYSEQIKRFYDFFPKERFLFLIFEDTMSNPALGLSKIASFLEIDQNKFDANIVDKKINSSKNFRFSFFFRTIRKFLKSQRVNGSFYSDSLINFLKRIYINLPDGIFQVNETENFSLDLESYQILTSAYKLEILELENMLNIELSVWKK
jgi:hypothetical protein